MNVDYSFQPFTGTKANFHDSCNDDDLCESIIFLEQGHFQALRLINCSLYIELYLSGTRSNGGVKPRLNPTCWTISE